MAKKIRDARDRYPFPKMTLDAGSFQVVVEVTEGGAVMVHRSDRVISERQCEKALTAFNAATAAFGGPKD